MLNKLTRTGLCWLWIAALVIALDRVSKLWVIKTLALYESLTVLPFFNITLARNTGAAFSFLHSASGWQNVFFVTLAFIVSIMLLRWLFILPVRDWWMSTALSLVLGGALGNVWDRLEYQYVIDFLHFHLGDWNFAIFNIADSAICIGAFMIVIGWYRTSNVKS